MASPAVFIDRDGTINVEKNYLVRFQDWEWIPGAIDAIKRLNSLGSKVIVISNQAGVARGYYTESDVERLHDRVNAELKRLSARIDGYYYCPHHPDYGSRKPCECRKPAPGMILRAARDLCVDLSQSYLIGDKESDIRAGFAAGVAPIMVATGYGKLERRLIPERVPYESDVLAAVERIEREARRAHARSRPVL